mgnify:CR=1 FL=1|jgi:DNA-binding CsgD family transcriptional regulator
MITQDSTGMLGALRTTASVTMDIGALPAVATLDWCDGAAGALARIAPPAFACVIIATVEPGGDMLAQEVVGVAGRLGDHGAPAGGLLPATERRLSHLRTTADRLRHVGWQPSPEAIAQGRCGALSSLAGGRDWRIGPLGAMWGEIEPSDLLVGLYPLGSTERGRSLIVHVAPTSPGAVIDDEHAAILSATLPLLAERAVLAIGERRAGASRWLTIREQQVLEQLTLGHSVREIAETLDRSPHTVHDHVKSLHRKLNASSRGELIARALGHLAEPVDRSRQGQTSEAADELAQVIAGKHEPADHRARD